MYTRLANAITETPPRPNSKEEPSKRQQGESKRTKAAGWKNYYDMFNTKGRGEEDAEETGEIEEQSGVRYSQEGKRQALGRNRAQMKK